MAHKPSALARPDTTPAVIALTGTGGFLGGSLLRKLEADPRYTKILAIDGKKPLFEVKRAKFHRLDLTETLADSKLLEIFQKEKVDTVVHAAIPFSPPRSLEQAHELVSIGTMHLLDACASMKVRKIVMASTTEIYGAHPSNPNFLSEDHPLRGGFRSRFLRDKIEAEGQAQKFAARHPETIVTILRPCTILGPNVRGYRATFLQQPVIFTVMGYDPLFQFVHEDDVFRAFKTAVDEDYPGIFNIVGNGVLPLSKVLRLIGKISIPVPYPVFRPVVQMMWLFNISPAPPSRLAFLKYLCVADGDKAKKVMGFIPRCSTKEVLLSFIGAQRFREARLLEPT